MWMSGYVLEGILSFDNLFVFHLIFSAYGRHGNLKHRPLYLGIIGAVVFRLAFIFLGSHLMHSFIFSQIEFGAFHVYTGIKTVAVEEDGDDDPLQHPFVLWLKDHMPFVNAYDYLTAYPKLTSISLNDAYRYTDWFLATSPILIEIIMVTKSDDLGNRQPRESLGSRASLGLGAPLLTTRSAFDRVQSHRSIMGVETMRNHISRSLSVEGRALEDQYKDTDLCQMCARHPVFQRLSMVLLALNALWIALNVEFNKAAVLSNAPLVFQVVENDLATFLVLVLRRPKALRGPSARLAPVRRPAGGADDL